MTERIPETLAEPLAELEELATDGPLVGIVMGSQSDMDVMQSAAKVLVAAANDDSATSFKDPLERFGRSGPRFG